MDSGGFENEPKLFPKAEAAGKLILFPHGLAPVFLQEAWMDQQASLDLSGDY